MRRWQTIGAGIAGLIVGLMAPPIVGQTRPVFAPAMFRGEPAAVAAEFLDGALRLAGNGSWERIAVGRAYYLGGDKSRGQRIFDSVTGVGKVEGSDWVRIARVYVEAGEWDRAREAFERALTLDDNDDTLMVEYGALANLHQDRAKAEALFTKALRENSRHFWHWVGVGGSYLGVPQQ